MREITRIHIAKVAYDIEVDAKKDIETYINALERYAEDPEILVDIEIRITELLAERGVAAGGVIAAQDVVAVRSQLGEPSEFATDDHTRTTDEALTQEESQPRRVYRDEDEAILGGVLAGIGRFFGVDPVWVRIAFLILLVISYGTAIFVYLVLWLIIPAAKTGPEKLRMSGKPVTLASIKEMVGSDSQNERAATARRVVRTGAGLAVIAGGVGSLLVTLAAGGGLTLGLFDENLMANYGFSADSIWYSLALILLILAGLLLSTLCFIVADATFRKKWSRRTAVTVVAIIAAGLVAFTGGVGSAWYGAWLDDVRINELRETSTTALPEGFNQVRRVEIGGRTNTVAQVNVEYVVSSVRKYEFESLPGVAPEIRVGDDGASATIDFRAQDDVDEPVGGRYHQSVLRVYGPALEEVRIKDGRVNYRNDRMQDMLRVYADKGSFELSGGSKEVVVFSREDTRVSLADATVEILVANMNGGSVVAGVVRELTVNQHDVCPKQPMYGRDNRAEVQAVSSGKWLYNGTEKTDTVIEEACGSVIIGDEAARNARNL